MGTFVPLLADILSKVNVPGSLRTVVLRDGAGVRTVVSGLRSENWHHFCGLQYGVLRVVAAAGAEENRIISNTE